MRIAFSGCSNSGKTSLIQAFLKRWPMYKLANFEYRQKVDSNEITHSLDMSDESQLLILDSIMKEQEKHQKDDNVVYDRCSWDVMAYTLLGNEMGKISDPVTAAIISFVKESLKNIDIIFWLGFNSAIKIINNNTREINPTFIKNTDDIFQQLYKHYCDEYDEDVFYPKEDSPAIIKIEDEFLSIGDRIAWIGEFIDQKGNLIETGESVLDPKNLEMMEQMLKDQGLWIEKDAQYKNLTDQIKNFKI
jgi:predicted ATPase